MRASVPGTRPARLCCLIPNPHVCEYTYIIMSTADRYIPVHVDTCTAATARHTLSDLESFRCVQEKRNLVIEVFEVEESYL